VDAFPSALWGSLLARHARNTRPDRLREADARGYRPLREAIAEHLRVYRGVLCTADQVVIGGGTQQILDLLARLLLEEGDFVWMEDPGHFGAHGILRGAGARLVPVAVDEAGIDVGAGIAAAPEARMAYVTPARQSPLGATLSLERRVQLLEWARQRDAWVFEDDYDSEFRYDGRPLPALQGLDRHGVVLYTGTFTKTMFPGIRLRAICRCSPSWPWPISSARDTSNATFDGCECCMRSGERRCSKPCSPSFRSKSKSSARVPAWKWSHGLLQESVTAR
jgi:GntR family transcriptional regulator/MocR family aminotransferase